LLIHRNVAGLQLLATNEAKALAFSVDRLYFLSLIKTAVSNQTNKQVAFNLR
jgi:hypothetical protein